MVWHTTLHEAIERFMALHELASLAGYETEEYRAATSTPWRERVIGAVMRRERLRFELIAGLTAK